MSVYIRIPFYLVSHQMAQGGPWPLWPNPRSPLSGCLYRDVIWGTESLCPIVLQCNIAEIYGGLALYVYMKRMQQVVHKKI